MRRIDKKINIKIVDNLMTINMVKINNKDPNYLKVS